MKKVTFICLLTFAVIGIHKADAQDMSPEQVGWMQRTLIPTAIGKLRTIRELSSWCVYEMEQPEPDQTPCQLAEQSRKNSTITKDAQMIKAGIAEMKSAPQTPIIQEHVRVLESGLQEIKEYLQPLCFYSSPCI